MESINYPLTNMQLELLKLFSRDIDEKDLVAIKQLIVKYLAEKLNEETNKVWEEKGWTQDTMDEFLNTHMRTKYNSPK